MILTTLTVARRTLRTVPDKKRRVGRLIEQHGHSTEVTQVFERLLERRVWLNVEQRRRESITLTTLILIF